MKLSLFTPNQSTVLSPPERSYDGCSDGPIRIALISRDRGENLDLAQELIRRGHQVHLLTEDLRSGPNDLADEGWVHPIKSEPLAGETLQEISIRLRDDLEWAKAAYRKVTELHRSEGLDIVSCPLGDLQGYFCARDRSLPTLLTLTSRFEPLITDDTLHRRTLEEDAIHAARFIQADSRSTLKRVGRQYGVSEWPSITTIVPPGIRDRVGPVLHQPRTTPRLRVLYRCQGGGRETIQPLSSEFPQVEFHLSQDSSGPWSALSHDPNRALQSHHPWEWANCDIVCVSGQTGEHDEAILAAMMFGKPVIATATGNIPEIVQEGRTGYLVYPGSDSSMAHALRRLLHDEEWRHQMGCAGRERYEDHFTLERMTDVLLASYQSVVSECRLAARAPFRSTSR